MNKSIKKNLILGISILMIITVSYFLYHFLAYMKYPKSTIVQTASSWYADMEKHTLIEITTDSSQYEHNFRNKANYVKTDKDLIFICEDNSENAKGAYLTINNNGSIYIVNQEDTENTRIGFIENAVCGAINRDNIAIITADGHLYFKGKLGNRRYDEFELLNEVSDVKDVVCGKTYTFVLTGDGQVYGIGLNPEEEDDYFKHYETTYPVTDLCGTDETIVALDRNGNVYELGHAYFMYSGWRTYSEFHKIKKYKNIVAISTGINHGILLDKRGRVHYWGNECRGKASEVSVNGTIKGIFSADGIYCSGYDLYIMQKDKVFHIELDD